MKAIKSCINPECESFIHQVKYDGKYIYCPMCSEKLVYVCADCWKPLPHSTEKYCPECKEKRRIKKEQQQQKLMDGGVKAAQAAAAVVGAVGAVVKNGNQIVKVIKKK